MKHTSPDVRMALDMLMERKAYFDLSVTEKLMLVKHLVCATDGTIK